MMREYVDIPWLTDQVEKHAITAFIGRNDTGKSTLIRHIAPLIGAYVLDCDIGQSDIGPPATVSLGEKSGGAYRMKDGYFCGSTTPARHFLQLIAGASRMVRLAAEKPVLVNTTGLVSGDAGRSLKTEKLNAIRPDLIVAIQASDELKYLDAFRKCGTDVIFTRPLPGVRQKSRAERTHARQASFQSHFEGAVTRRYSLDTIGIERSLINNGAREESRLRQLTGPDGILRAEVSAGEALIVCNGPIADPEKIAAALGVKTIQALTPGDFSGVLVGLMGKTGSLKGLGIIESLDLSSEEARIFTAADEFSVMQLGSIKLDRTDFSYAGAFYPEVFRT